ncbi:hypothetical protein D9C73_008173 [Collichthys lucidus]|uniref:Uncharacterized protein n=1 Tax=Collichthys lucidus TaxID=240159 RepID=A0A4V6ANU2_COLLU|nr:hypothetical protein D9C73_008173 [Collichthys lucidus]
MAPGKMQAASEQDSVILAELRRLRKEHTEAANDNKKAMARLETNMKELVERTASLEQQVEHVEERLGDMEDKTARLERVAAFLLHQEAKLVAKCEDLESRAIRNNIRINGIPEGSEKNDMIRFAFANLKDKDKDKKLVCEDPDVERVRRGFSGEKSVALAPPPEEEEEEEDGEAHFHPWVRELGRPGGRTTRRPPEEPSPLPAGPGARGARESVPVSVVVPPRVFLDRPGYQPGERAAPAGSLLFSPFRKSGARIPAPPPSAAARERVEISTQPDLLPANSSGRSSR